MVDRMADSNLRNITEKKIKILLVDDSIVFRKFIQEAIKGQTSLYICGIAKNGIEALDLILKVQPDVILMDLEMPLMDGITALQHLMIHRPTSTIIFSSHADNGSREANAAFAHGAVGFFSKADFFDSSQHDAFSAKICQAIIDAAQAEIEPLAPSTKQQAENTVKKESSKRLVFCEECGARNAVDITAEMSSDSLPLCCECGDPLIMLEQLKSGLAS